MTTIERHGKNINEIINQVKKDFNITDEDFSYEIIQEYKKGFLGVLGNKNAIIKFTIHKLKQNIIDYLRELALYAQVTIDEIDIQIDEDYIQVQINKVSDPGFFIGKDGKFLHSLQYLLNQTFSQEIADKKSILLDIEGYKERQEQNLIRRVQHLSEQAIKTKRNITLEPMVSSQRRIVHQTVKDIEEIRTMTIGEGAHKRIVLSPSKGNKTGVRKFYKNKNNNSQAQES